LIRFADAKYEKYPVSEYLRDLWFDGEQGERNEERWLTINSSLITYLMRLIISSVAGENTACETQSPDERKTCPEFFLPQQHENKGDKISQSI
jgi:hypothetical protein